MKLRSLRYWKSISLYNLTFDIAKANDGRHILYATKGKINRVGNAKVNSLKIRGSKQNSNSNTNLTQVDPSVKRKDLEYQYAVNKGDSAAVQRLVDKAAKTAGYTIKAYHGTDADSFTVFDKGRIGSTTGVSILGDGFYFAADKRTAKQYGKNVFTVYLKQTNPYSATENDAYKLSSLDLERQGYDSVVLPAGKGNIYMVLDPEQIKSADPVTYDDDGNVIPLSQRFNPTNNDMRYSVSSDGISNQTYGSYNVYGEDVALETQSTGENSTEDLGPVREDLEKAPADPTVIDKRLEHDKEKLEEAFQAARTKMEAEVADKNGYIKKKATGDWQAELMLRAKRVVIQC